MNTLPAEFTAYMSNNGEDYFEFSIPYVYIFAIQIWPYEDIEQLNEDYEVDIPDFTAFGTDGGLEMFVFDLTGAIYALPFTPMHVDDAVYIAASWTEFLARKV